MKKFDNPKELFQKIVKLHEEVKDVLWEYIEKENISTDNYIEKLSNNYNELAEYVFDRLETNSWNFDYLVSNSENMDGDFQILTSFIRFYITEQILDAIISFEDAPEGN